MKWQKRSIYEFSKTEYDRCLSLMEPTRKETVLAMAERRQKATVLGEWMVKTILSEECGISIEEIKLRRTEKGKPFAEGLPHFSITHSGEWVAVAISSRPVGIDMEKIRPVDPRLAERIGAKPERFFEEWTTKEAHFKIYGNPNFKEIDYESLSPRHFYDEDYIITIIEKEQ